jgi:nitrite reductase/ring-hydroxylating ferredoxin subunit
LTEQQASDRAPASDTDAHLVLPCPPRGAVTYHWISRTQQIMLFWLHGRLRACSAVCPHMGARLAVDTRRAVITCPWHGLTADIGPVDAENFSCSHARYRRIRQYRVDPRGDRTAVIQR